MPPRNRGKTSRSTSHKTPNKEYGGDFSGWETGDTQRQIDSVTVLDNGALKVRFKTGSGYEGEANQIFNPDELGASDFFKEFGQLFDASGRIKSEYAQGNGEVANAFANTFSKIKDNLKSAYLDQKRWGGYTTTDIGELSYGGNEDLMRDMSPQLHQFFGVDPKALGVQIKLTDDVVNEWQAKARDQQTKIQKAIDSGLYQPGSEKLLDMGRELNASKNFLQTHGRDISEFGTFDEGAGSWTPAGTTTPGTTPGTAPGTDPGTTPGTTPTTPGTIPNPMGGVNDGTVQPNNGQGVTAGYTGNEPGWSPTAPFGPTQPQQLDQYQLALNALKEAGIDINTPEGGKAAEILFPMMQDATARAMQQKALNTQLMAQQGIEQDPLLQQSRQMAMEQMQNPLTFDDKTMGLMRGQQADLLANQEAGFGERLRGMGATQGIDPSSPLYATLASQGVLARDIGLADRTRQLDIQRAMQDKQDRTNAATLGSQVGGAYRSMLGQAQSNVANTQLGAQINTMPNPFAGLMQGNIAQQQLAQMGNMDSGGGGGMDWLGAASSLIPVFGSLLTKKK